MQSKAFINTIHDIITHFHKRGNTHWYHNFGNERRSSNLCAPSSFPHYNDVIMSSVASQITSLTIVYSTVYSGADQKKTSKLRVAGLCVGNAPVTGEFPAQMASNAENVSIWWRHHDSNFTHSRWTGTWCIVQAIGNLVKMKWSIQFKKLWQKEQMLCYIPLSTTGIHT